MHTQRVVMTSMFLVLFGSTIFQSCQSVGTSEAIYDMRFDAITFGTTIATQHQNVTYEGNLFVNNNETFTIQDVEFYLMYMGKIIVQDTSTLIIQNSTFRSIPSWDHESIVLEDQARLILENATMIGSNNEIIVRNHTDLYINRSAFQGWWEVLSYDEAEIHVNNSTITTGDIYARARIITYGTSSATVENSDIDGCVLKGNSTVSIKNSVIGRTIAGGTHANVNITDSTIRTILGWGRADSIVVQNSSARRVELSGDSSVRLTGSSVGDIEAHGNSSFRLTRGSVGEIEAHGNASIMLIDCHAGRIETHDDATVFVSRHLPLFGLVTMHYTWVPIIQTIITLTVFAIIIIVLEMFLFRKRARHRQREPTGASEAKKIYRTIVYPYRKKKFSEENHQCPSCGKRLKSD